MKSLFKYPLFALALVVLSSSYFISTPKLFVARGRVTQTFTYCGGAYMPEVIEKGRTPTPLPGKTIYIKEGAENSLKNNVIRTVTTNDKGNFEVKLPIGTYCLMEEYKTQKVVVPANDQFSNYDAECIKKRWQNCDYTLHIEDKDVDSISINYNRECSFTQPCQNYHGPMPPSVAH